MMETLKEPTDLSEIVNRIENLIIEQGFEAYPFQIGWYNAALSTDAFTLNYDPSTLAFLLINTPDMFEKGFIPWLPNESSDDLRDPLDQFMASVATSIRKTFEAQHYKLSVFHDFEMQFNRKPKVLMQTAGHVSGAAFYYQSSGLTDQIEPKQEGPLYGVSLHPKYGGWFAFRMIVIFENVKCGDNLLQKKEPMDVLITNDKKIELLLKFNNNWQDWSYRSVFNVEQQYSDRQKKYFSTKPSERSSLIKIFKNELSNENN